VGEDHGLGLATAAPRGRSATNAEPPEAACPAPATPAGQRERASLVAIKFGAGRPIHIAIRVTGRFVELSIRDEGIGISADRLSTIFQPLERAVPKEHFGGLGLGLYIAQALVVAHGGTLEVASQLGEGSTFLVRLPGVEEVAFPRSPITSRGR